MLKLFFEKAKKRLDEKPLTSSINELNRRVRKTLRLKESYTCMLLRVLSSVPALPLPGESTQLFQLVWIALCLIIALAVFLPGYLLFAVIIVMYLLFVSARKKAGDMHSFSDLDILLVMFCFVVLSVASVGKDIQSVCSIWLMFGSFIALYFVTVNTATSKERLFELKYLFCMAGTLMALIQLGQHIFSFEMRVLGQIYVLSVPMAFELFFETENKRLRVFLAASALAMFIALTVCWSGGSWVWATCILAFFVVIRDWRLLLVGGIGLLFVPFFLPGEIIDFHKLAQNGIVSYLFEPSAEYRITAYRAFTGILEYYRDYPSIGKWHASIVIVGCIAVLLLLLLREIFFSVKSGQMGMMCALLSAVGFGVTGFLYSDMLVGIWSHYKALLIFWVYTSLYSAGARLADADSTALKPEGRARFCFIDTVPVFLFLAYVLAMI